MKKVDLNFIAKDYQPIAEIEIINENPVFEKKHPVKQIILYDFIKKCDSKSNRDDRSDHSIYICRGEERKRDKISLFADFKAEHIPDAINWCLNGIVGVLAGNVSYGEGGLKKKVEEYFGADAAEDIPEEALEFHINIQIISRFDSIQHPFFVASLLLYGNIETNKYYVYEGQDEIFDFLLIDLLRQSLLEAIPKGHYRRYRRFEENNDRIRGTIDIARHIRMNMGQNNGCIAYTYKEYSMDNPFNALILAAYDRLKNKYTELVASKIDADVALRDFLSELKKNVSASYSLTKLMSDNNVPIAHPYFQEYEVVRQICLRILRDESASIFDATEGEVSGFLYYLPDLWEEFLERVFVETLEAKEGYKLATQEKAKYVESNDDKGYSCVARPDFVFKEHDHRFLILDAKMKPNWLKSICSKGVKGSLSGLVGEDIDKCLRDMAVFHVNGTGVVFPIAREHADTEIKYKRKISEYNEHSFFYILPFVVPDSEESGDYSSWKQEFLDQISDFKGKLSDKVIREAIIERDRKYNN